MIKEKFTGSDRPIQDILISLKTNRELLLTKGTQHEQQIVDDIRVIRNQLFDQMTHNERFAFNEAFEKFSEKLQQKYGRAYLDNCRLWHLLSGSTPTNPSTMLDFPDPEDSVIRFLAEYIAGRPSDIIK